MTYANSLPRKAADANRSKLQFTATRKLLLGFSEESLEGPLRRRRMEYAGVSNVSSKETFFCRLVMIFSLSKVPSGIPRTSTSKAPK
jgi:hypothetical protein